MTRRTINKNHADISDNGSFRKTLDNNLINFGELYDDQSVRTGL